MTKKWIKRVCLTLILTPILLFIVLMILLYIPPIQNFICREVTAYASEATGMHINIRRVDLRFPLKLLVRGVEVIQAPDTLLTLDHFSASVQVLPLFKGKAEIDNITLSGGHVNSANLLDGMQISGSLGYFSLRSHGVDWSNETAVINQLELSDTRILLCVNDTTETPKDSTKAAINWKASLLKLKLSNVFFALKMPADSLSLNSYVGQATVKNVEADLGKEHYGLGKLQLSNSIFNYHTGTAVPASGFDPSHIVLRNINSAIDSVSVQGRNMHALIRQFSLEERSGLSITSLTGNLHMDSTGLYVPDLKLTTPHSDLNFMARISWNMKNRKDDLFATQLDAHIGKQDVLLFMGGLSETFRKEYPFRPFVMKLDAKGNVSTVVTGHFSAELPGAFSLTGNGEVENVLDSVGRIGSIDLQMKTQELGFLTALTGMPGDGSFVIPDNMILVGKAAVRGSQYMTLLRVREGLGVVHLDGNLNTETKEYTANLKVDSLEVNHFLPKDSIYRVAASATLKGKGFDFTSSRTSAFLEASIDKLEYASYRLRGVHFTGNLENTVASAHVTSNNSLLVMDATGSYALNKGYTDAQAKVDVSHVDLYALGVVPEALKNPVAFVLDANVGKDTVGIALHSGDLNFRLRSRSTLEQLAKESEHFIGVLTKQLKDKHLDHIEMRHALPSAGLLMTSGRENILSYVLATRNIKYSDLNVGFLATPRVGINGRATVHALKVDTLQLDTVFFSVKQDTACMAFRGGVINGPKNPQFVFNSSLTGEIRSKDAELTLRFEDGKGETGILLGVNAQTKKNGVLFRLTPDRPVVAFRNFDFNGHNSVFVRDDYRVFADVEMLDKAGMGLLVHSIEEEDTTFMQNLDIEVRRIELTEISKVLPYFPDFGGLFSLEANYKQSAKNMQVSAEGTINNLAYEHNSIGNIGVGVTWLPDNLGMHYLDAYLTSEDVQIMSMGGTYQASKDVVSMNSALEHFPLKIANAFISDETIRLSGDIDGELAIAGPVSKPQVTGQLILDSVSTSLKQYGFNFCFDNRPVQIANNKVVFDKFAIYTTTNNPFTIDGYVDVTDLSRPVANLSLTAANYQLLNASRSEGSILYGKVFLDITSTVKGPLNKLVMRGNVNLLNNTDVTYVMFDSPLSVQDRLEDLVEFTSFSDTIATVEEKQFIPFFGLDMLMTIRIGQAVKAKVDLSPDRSSRVELQGGGNLSLRYTPQGEMSLSGRYTLTAGTINYSLPVIPLKEFKINNGSYVEWMGDIKNPTLKLKATERMRALVPNANDDGTRMVNFDVSIEVKNKLANLGLIFDLDAPDDLIVQDQLKTMDVEERNKQAITMMATGMYLAGGAKAENFNMGAALNSVLQNQIASLAGSALKSANISFGMENYDSNGSKRTDYSFSYAQRFFNDRVQVVIGGTISTGADTRETNSFIDNVSLEYRLDNSGTRYVRLYHDRSYQNALEGEYVETGVGLVLRKKVGRLGDLFIFKKRKK